MLLVDDNAKELLEQNNIPYGEYMTPTDLYLTAVLNVSIESAIKYNDGNIEDPETINNYIAYIKQADVVKKCINKLDKANHDILNIICEVTEGKHEEINNPKSGVTTEE